MGKGGKRKEKQQTDEYNIVLGIHSAMAVAEVCSPQEKGGKHKPMYSSGVKRKWTKEGKTKKKWVLIRFLAAMMVAEVCGQQKKGKKTQTNV